MTSSLSLSICVCVSIVYFGPLYCHLVLGLVQGMNTVSNYLRYPLAVAFNLVDNVKSRTSAVKARNLIRHVQVSFPFPVWIFRFRWFFPLHFALSG